jgi:4'-phosphopantetheinyl transferase
VSAEDGYALGWAFVSKGDDANPPNLDILTPAERARFARSTPDLARRFLGGRDLLRRLVAESTGVPVRSVVISARCPDCGAEHGRPVVAGPIEARYLTVSLTYAAGTAFAVASHDRGIGVDAEPLDTSDSRIDAITTLTGATRSEALLHWTRVEAVLKADGRGLRLDPSVVSIHLTDGTAWASVEDSSRRYLLSEPRHDHAIQVSVAVEA